MIPGEKIVLALDCDLKKADHMVNFFDNYINCFKIGLPLFLESGRVFVSYLHNRNKKVILDLNVCEIPSIAVKIINRLKKLNIDAVTVNLFGGFDMLCAVKEASENKIKLIGKSVNSSFNTTLMKQMINNKNDMMDIVDRLVKLAVVSGIDSVICSPSDNKKVKRHGRIIYNTGIRYKEKSGEHKRWATPAEAIEMGAKYIILGREIYNSTEPFTVYQNIISSIENMQ